MPSDREQSSATGKQPTATWPDELFETEVERIASVTALLLAEPAAWVHRRVETITFLDDIRIRRHMSVDFTLPSIELPIDYVPLSLIRKGVLKDLDIFDEEGRALPLLTRSQSAEVAAYILRTQAEPILQPGEKLEEGVWTSFRDIAGLPRNAGDAPGRQERTRRAQAALGEFREAKPNAPSISERQRRLFWHDLVVRPWMIELSDQFVFLSPIDTTSGQRRVVKLSYEETLDQPPGQRSQKARQALGLDHYSIKIRAPALLDAESYHVEINPLAEVVIAEARLVRYLESVDAPDGAWPIAPEVVSCERAADRAHLYGRTLSRGETQELSRRGVFQYGEVELDFSVRPSLLWPVMLIALVTTGMFAVGAIAHWLLRWHPRPDAAALIVAIPAFFAAYLVPGEHRLVRRMFYGVRLLVFVSAVVSLAAGATLAVDLNGRPWWWAGLGALSLAASWLIGLALSRARSAVRTTSGVPLH